jgi:hypothetical protein
MRMSTAAVSPFRCVLVLGVAVGGCVGTIDATPGGAASGVEGDGSRGAGGPGQPPKGGGGPSQPGGLGLPAASCTSPAPGPSLIRRLTRREYDNTVADLLGDRSNPARLFPAEERRLGFDNNASALTISPLLAEQYLRTAERLAGTAVENNLPALLGGCDPIRKGEDACAETFIQSMGTRAFRRPPEPDEVQRLTQLFTAGKAASGFKNGIRLALMAMLQSPRFLYRIEGGGPGPGGVVAVDSWEMASRLSYLFWKSMPDAELLQAAAAGKLVTRGEVAAQATRLLADPRAKEMVADFHEQWLALSHLDTVEKDSTAFPKWGQSLIALMKTETRRFIDHVIWEGPGDVGTLLTAPYTFANAPLATFYGVSGPPGTAFEKVNLPPGQPRGGLLTHGGVMAMLAAPDHTSPVERGLFVREQLLCQPMPAPPNDVNIELPKLTPGMTTRERFAKHAADPSCATCHKLIDPIGLALEEFDAIGLSRTVDNGKEIDLSGTLAGTDVDGPFVGTRQLSGKLATSEVMRDCVVRQWFRYGFGRVEADKQGDACTVDLLKRTFATNRYDVKALLTALTETDAFRFRRNTAGETR